MARKNVITLLSGCILICTVLFCTLNAYSSGVTVKVKKFTISGSTGVAGVEMQGFPDGMKVETDQSGFYTAEVEYGKSFTIKPVKPGYNFTPASKPYTNVTKDYENQDYTGKAITYIISGKVGDMADVVLSARRGPVSGFHSLVVPMTIINSILLAMASEEGGVMENLDKLDQLRERLKKYSGSSS